MDFPKGLSSEQKVLYRADFQARHSASLQQELSGHIKAAGCALILTTLTANLFAFGIWFATIQQPGLVMALTIPTTIMVGAGGVAITVLLTIKVAQPAYAEGNQRGRLNETMSTEGAYQEKK